MWFFCVNLDFYFIHVINTSIANIYHIIYTPVGLLSLQHLPYYLHTCWTCIFATFTILSTHLLDLYLCNFYHIIYTPVRLVSLQHLPYYLHTCWTCIFATFTILSTHLLDLYLFNIYHIIYTPVGLVSLQHLPYYLHTCWTCIFATFTILSTHLLDLYLCLPSAILVKISIFTANRSDMSSELGDETRDPRRDMKTIAIKDIIYRLWSEGNPLNHSTSQVMQ
jgi:hypothetical protein